ncbi:MAG: hypothetical protein HQ564_06950 [Candidatus Saganbacteria bacterium]|nr:hypothetical protein [Candidatus Saganbacteria bacterium]
MPKQKEYRKPELYCFTNDALLDCINGTGASNTGTCQGGDGVVSGNCFNGEVALSSCISNGVHAARGCTTVGSFYTNPGCGAGIGPS